MPQNQDDKASAAPCALASKPTPPPPTFSVFQITSMYSKMLCAVSRKKQVATASNLLRYPGWPYTSTKSPATMDSKPLIPGTSCGRMSGMGTCAHRGLRQSAGPAVGLRGLQPGKDNSGLPGVDVQGSNTQHRVAVDGLSRADGHAQEAAHAEDPWATVLCINLLSA